MPVAVINSKVVLFVHVPKTGGSSVERFLEEHGVVMLKNSRHLKGFSCSLQHLHADPLSAIIEAKKLDFRFMIIRHPVARIASEYRYQMRKQNWLRERLEFSEWLAYALTRRGLNPWYRDNHFRPQHEFELPGTEIFRFEDGVDTCIAQVAKRLDLSAPQETIREKKSPKRAFRFTKRDLARIENAYAQDFERYAYSMEQRELLEAGLSEDMIP